MRPLRILTWHVHGSYLYYLVQSDHQFFLPTKPDRPEGYGGKLSGFEWGNNVQDVPADRVCEMEFDCILFQSRKNYLEDQYEILSESQRRLPRLYLEHDPPRESPTDTAHIVDDADVLLVHVTHFNQLMWNNGRSPTCVIEHGVMVPRKGVDTAIQGFARFCQMSQHPARLIVVGGELDDPDPRIQAEIERLHAIADQAEITDHIQFVGRKGREVLRYYYSAADVFITTPWYEPFGITPIEAMACGTPVIGSNVGGIKFSVADGETGYLVAPNDPDAIAHRLQHLYDHPALLKTLSRQAVRRANDQFTWQKVADAVANLYETVLIQKAVGQPQEAFAVLDRGFNNILSALQESQRCLQTEILNAATMISDCFARGGKVLICGNGGSAADAQHWAAELVGRFKISDRPGLPALALTADSALLTAWSNDVGFDQVFARQVAAFAQPHDVLIGISTSGRSPNLLRAFECARDRGLRCLAILGGDGGELRRLADLAIVVPAIDAQHIQEVQIVVIHLLCELVELAVVANHQQNIQEVETRISKVISPDFHSLVQPMTHPVAITD